MSQDQINAIQELGLHEYLGLGGELPNRRILEVYFKKVDAFLSNPSTRSMNGVHYEGKKMIYVDMFYNEDLNIIIAIDKFENKHYISGQEFKLKQFKLCLENRIYLFTKDKLRMLKEFKKSFKS